MKVMQEILNRDAHASRKEAWLGGNKNIARNRKEMIKKGGGCVGGGSVNGWK